MDNITYYKPVDFTIILNRATWPPIAFHGLLGDASVYRFLIHVTQPGAFQLE